MEKWIGDLLIDVSPPERPKFRPLIILVHGLWSGSWCWHTWATHFCNLGWECWAVNFRGRFGESSDQALKRLTFEACVDDLKRIICSAAFPPIVVGHGFGGLVSQKAAEGEKCAAMVLLSTLPAKEVPLAAPRPLRLLRLKYAPLIFLRRPFCLEEADFRRLWLASVPEGRRPAILRRMVAESSLLVGEFFARRVEVDPKRLCSPLLVIGGGADRVVPIEDQREMARWLKADLKEYPNHGHWILGEDDGEAIVREIHRWLVQKFGEDILLASFSDRG